MKRKKSGEKRRTPSAVAALGGKPIEIARIDGDAEAWLAVFADRIAVATDEETEERHWFEFERATWSGNTLTMPFVDWNIPAFELKLADGEEDIALVVRERLERSIVVRRSAKLPSGAEVRAMVRRDDKDDLFTQVIIDGRAKEEDEEAIAELEETLRDIVGLEPEGADDWGVSAESAPGPESAPEVADAAGPSTLPADSEGTLPSDEEAPAAAEQAPAAEAPLPATAETAEKPQATAEADVLSPEPLATAHSESAQAVEAPDAEASEAVGGPDVLEDVETVDVAGSAQAVETAEAARSASEPEARGAAAALAADGASSGEAPEASSARASDASEARGAAGSEAKPESAPESAGAPEPESVAPSEGAAVSEAAEHRESEPKPQSPTSPSAGALPGASDGLANPTSSDVGESSADPSLNSPKGGATQPSAVGAATSIPAGNPDLLTKAGPAGNPDAATLESAAEAGLSSAADDDAEGAAPGGAARGPEPESSE